MALRTHLVIGSAVRDDVSSGEESNRQSASIAFAERLFKEVTGRTADSAVYKEFRDRLFWGPQRLFDFVEISEDGKRLSKGALANLRRGMEESGKVILLGKNVADRIGRDQVPPEKRIEIPSPGSHAEDQEEMTLSDLLLVDPVVWELIARLAFELAT